MMAGAAPTRVISFLAVSLLVLSALVAPCPLLCQQAKALHRGDSLPEAPSLSAQNPDHSQMSDATRAEVFRAYLNASRFPVSQAPSWQAAATEAGQLGLIHFNPAAQHDAGDAFFAKYLSPAHAGTAHAYRTSTSDSLFGRATYAASSIVITHDDEGRGTLNTPYLLRVFASALAHSAYRPYWKRSVSQPFSDFGSTIGNDAGMKVFNEFKPGILQLVKTHTPAFVEKIEERFGHN